MYANTLLIFNSTAIMHVYVPNGSEPMDIGEEAGCDTYVQLVTAVGEQGAGSNVKETSIHIEEDSILDTDEGELSDEQDQ